MPTIETQQPHVDSAIRLLHANLLVKQSAVAEKIGLIWIPPTAQKGMPEGKVVCLGPGKRERKDDIKPRGMAVFTGEKVLFTSKKGYEHRGGMELNVNGEDVLLIHEDDVFCVVLPNGKMGAMVGRVLIKRDKDYDGPLVLPDLRHSKRTTSMRKGRGTVLSVGQHRYLQPGDVKEGDTVLFEAEAGLTREHDGMELVNLDERQIDAVET